MKSWTIRLAILIVLTIIAFLFIPARISLAGEKSSGTNEVLHSQPDTIKVPQAEPEAVGKNVAKKSSQNKVAGESTKPKTADTTGTARVVAYYFHRTHRCRTCLTIEKYAQQALEHYFKKELAEGKLEFKPMDMEKAENRHFVNDYQLYTSSLILSLRKKDKEVKWENLEQVWLLVRDMEKFSLYVKEKVEPYLQE